MITFYRWANNGTARIHIATLLGTLVFWGLIWASPSQAQDTGHHATSRSIHSFPSYSALMTPQSCAALFDEIAKALSGSATVSKGAIEWAVDYEYALGAGRPCPTIPAPPKTVNRQNLWISKKPPTERIPNITARQVSQADYNSFLSCAGRFEGGTALITRIYPHQTDEDKKTLRALINGAPATSEIMASIIHDLPIMAPHLKRAPAQAIYSQSKLLYDSKSNSSIDTQANFYTNDEALHGTCLTLFDRLTRLQVDYYMAQKAADK